MEHYVRLQDVKECICEYRWTYELTMPGDRLQSGRTGSNEIAQFEWDVDDLIDELDSLFGFYIGEFSQGKGNIHGQV